MILKAIIVGCGRVSRFHADAYRNIKGVNLVAGVDVDKGKRNIFSEKYRIPCYKSVKEALNELCPDVASVCSPSFLHTEMAVDLMKRGVSVVVEKPVCISEKQANMLLKVENETRTVASCCYQNRFNSPVVWLRKILNEGKLGKILLSQVCIRWFRRKDYFNDWHGLKLRSGGGVLMTQAIHHIDLLRLLVGLPKTITGYMANFRKFGEVEDTVIANMIMKNGSLSVVECSTIAYNRDFEASITIIGEKGTIKIGGKSINKIEYGEIEGVSIPEDVNQEDPVSVYGTSHILLIQNVVNSIINRTKPAVSLKDGVDSWRVVNDIYRNLQAKIY